MRFVRNYNNGVSYPVIGVASGGNQSMTVSGVMNGTCRDCITGGVIHVTGGTISFRVKGKSIGVRVLSGPGRIGSDQTCLR